MKQLIKLAFIILLTVSCTSRKSESNFDVTIMSKLEKVDKGQTSQNLDKAKKGDVVKKKIIKDGKLGIKVKDIKKAKSNVDSIVRFIGGYYDTEDLSNNNSDIEYDLKIRIPADKFEEFITRIENGENVVSFKTINARDVTDQFIDLQTRLNNKEKYMARYHELLKSAKSIKDILDIQERIRVLEEEIESTTGRLKYLNDLVNYSTLELNITQKKDFKYAPEERENFGEKIKQALIGGWFAFVDFLLFLINIWAFLIIISVLIYFWIKYRKRKKSKKTLNDSIKTPIA